MARNTVRYFPANSVTTIDHAAECDPHDAVLRKHDIDAIWQSVVRFYQSGVQPAISLCIRRHGKIILKRSIGHTHGNAPDDARNGHKMLATPDSLFNLFSASKAVTAMVIHHLEERDMLHLDNPLAEYLPEFGSGSKRFITVRHVLAHQSGLPTIPKTAFDLDNLHKDGAIREAIAQSEMQWRAGSTHGYHALSGGFILGELCKAVSGQDMREYFAEYFQKPMQMNTFNYGVAPDMVDLVAPHAYTGMPFPGVIERFFWKRLLGASYRRVIQMSNDPRFITGVIPAANVVGTAEETSRFYEMLLRGGEYQGARILQPETIRRAIAEQSDGFDRMLGMPMRYSMGFMLGRKRLSMYGNDTAKAFGHLGFVNVLGYADPERDISVGFLNNGKPGISTGMTKFYDVLNTISRVIPKIS